MLAFVQVRIVPKFNSCSCLPSCSSTTDWCTAAKLTGVRRFIMGNAIACLQEEQETNDCKETTGTSKSINRKNQGRGILFCFHVSWTCPWSTFLTLHFKCNVILKNSLLADTDTDWYLNITPLVI